MGAFGGQTVTHSGILTNPAWNFNQLHYSLLSVDVINFPVETDPLTQRRRAKPPPAIASQLISIRNRAALDGNHNIVFCCVRGSELVGLSLWNPPPLFDFVIPSRQDLGVEKGRQILPYSFIQSAIEPTLADTMSIYMGLRAAMPHTRLVHIFPPPPIADGRFVVEKLNRMDAEFQKVCARDGINSALLRLKYHYLYMDTLTTQLAALDISCLAPPPQAIDDEGYLLQEYWLDYTHANAAYGWLVLSQLEMAVSSSAH